MLPSEARELSPREFFYVYLKIATRNVITFGIITFVIYLLAKLSWWLGAILASIFGLIITISVIQFIFQNFILIGVTAAVIYSLFAGRRDEVPKDQPFVFATGLIHAIEVLFFVSFAFFLFKTLFSNA